MFTDVSIIESYARLLRNEGFIVNYYREGTNYDTRDLVNADIVLVIPYDRANNNYFYTGKGQYTEINICNDRKIPLYVIYGNNNIFDCKLINGKGTIIDSNDWKRHFSSFKLDNVSFDLFDILVNTSKEELLLIINI